MMILACGISCGLACEISCGSMMLVNASIGSLWMSLSVMCSAVL